MEKHILSSQIVCKTEKLGETVFIAKSSEFGEDYLNLEMQLDLDEDSAELLIAVLKKHFSIE